MLLSQVYAEPERKRKRDTGGAETDEKRPDHLPFGMKTVHGKQIDLLNIDSYFASSMSNADPSLAKKDVEDFMSSLTPGAQSVIHAASFIWGYENAARYLKNTMKLSEVKNAADMENKSAAVVESLQKQAEAGNEKHSEMNSVVWGFYNDDMKETQALSSRSETLSQLEKSHEKEHEHAHLMVQMPLSAQEAVGASVLQNSANPALVYCAGALAEADNQMQAKLNEVKREELAKLEALRIDKKSIQVKDATEIALIRREEVKDEYLKIEKELQAAVDKLDTLSRDEKKPLEKIANMLPSELRANLLANDLRFAKRVALRRKLMRWLTVARGLRRGITLVPKKKLKAILKLASFFR